MDNREKLQQKADDKLLGRLTDKAAFEQELANDPELAEVLAGTELAMEAIEAAEDQALKARLQQLEAGLAQPKESHLKVLRDTEEGGKVIPLRPPFWRRHLAAIAAALALVLTAGYFLLIPSANPDTQELLATNFEPYRNIAVDLTRSDAPSPEEIAFTAYENGEFAKAAELLAALGDDPAYRFYAAQAQLADGAYNQARELLEPLVADSEFALQPESEWYLALAEIGAGQLEEGIEFLRAVNSTPEHPFQQQAGELLRELDIR